jgi:flagellar hook-associated protein 1 FlgK
MYGANVGLEIGKRALLAQQLALNITGNNIANVNTPGYTRQQAILANSVPQTMPFGNVGTGVDISEIRRIRSELLDQQLRTETQELGKWNFLKQTWGQVESVFGEPSDTGLSTILDQFWNSWEELSENPSSEAARMEVREQANQLAETFHHFSSQLTDMRSAIDEDITGLTQEINSAAVQIANLNESISSAELGGNQANDLRDRRDYLIDQLSQYADVGVVEQSDGTATVYLGSMALVDGITCRELQSTIESDGDSIIHTLRFKGSAYELRNIGGQLEGMIKSRDEVIGGKLADLDLLARELAKTVNETHRQGFGSDGSTGVNFFNPDTTGAADIELDAAVVNDLSRIAAGRDGQQGDNSNAIAMAGLRNLLAMHGGNSTFGDYFGSIIGEVGIKSQQAQSLEKNQEALVSQIENSRLSTSGVSLDEEMAKMIQYEHAYTAAARVINAMDSALDTIINGLGNGTS